jgi:hypothetical protein
MTFGTSRITFHEISSNQYCLWGLLKSRYIRPIFGH